MRPSARRAARDLCAASPAVLLPAIAPAPAHPRVSLPPLRAPLAASPVPPLHPASRLPGRHVAGGHHVDIHHHLHTLRLFLPVRREAVASFPASSGARSAPTPGQQRRASAGRRGCAGGADTSAKPDAAADGGDGNALPGGKAAGEIAPPTAASPAAPAAKAAADGGGGAGATGGEGGEGFCLQTWGGVKNLLSMFKERDMLLQCTLAFYVRRRAYM